MTQCLTFQCQEDLPGLGHCRLRQRVAELETMLAEKGTAHASVPLVLSEESAIAILVESGLLPASDWRRVQLLHEAMVRAVDLSHGR